MIPPPGKPIDQNFLILASLMKLHCPEVITKIEHPEEKTELVKLLQTPSQMRSKKILRHIKAELAGLRCFEVQRLQGIPREQIPIMKRDVETLLKAISTFVHVKRYSKGSLLEVVAKDRDRVRVLLKGELLLFAPRNPKSYASCVEKSYKQELKLDWLNSLLTNLANVPSENDSESEDSVSLDLLGTLVNQQEPIRPELALRILKKSNVHATLSPQRLTHSITASGAVIASEQSPYFLKQPSKYECSVICATECFVMELEYSIYREAMSIISSDQDKKYIRALLALFPMMDYLQAREYVRKDQMVGRRVNSQDNPEEVGSNFQILYSNELYVLVEGEVTLQVNKIQQVRFTDSEYATSKMHFQSKNILTIYPNDFFGFERIGKEKKYGLKYLASQGSKCLRIEEAIYVKHLYTIEGFRAYFTQIRDRRDALIQGFIAQMQASLETQMLQKYKKSSRSVSNIPTLLSHSPRINKVQYFGSNQFQSISQIITTRIAAEKEAQPKANFRLTPNNVQQFLGQLKFASGLGHSLPSNCRIENGFIEMRNTKGKLLRKKNILIEESRILHKMGVLSGQERNQHNLNVVLKRRSNHEFEDFNKERAQLKRLDAIRMSLPKLTQLYAKKQNILYRQLHRQNP